jgi:hypothetical protein
MAFDMIWRKLRCPMLPTLLMKKLILVLSSLLLPIGIFAHVAGQDSATEGSYRLTRTAGDRTQFSLIIYESEERTVSGVFSIDQLKILQALMAEAEKFALTGEATGTDNPTTTRFYDKQEIAFIVDVQKIGTRSQLFFTLKTDIGRLTVSAGTINRGTRREQGFFFDLLSQVESEVAKSPNPPPK